MKHIFIDVFRFMNKKIQLFAQFRQFFGYCLNANQQKEMLLISYCKTEIMLNQHKINLYFVNLMKFHFHKSC